MLNQSTTQCYSMWQVFHAHGSKMKCSRLNMLMLLFHLLGGARSSIYSSPETVLQASCKCNMRTQIFLLLAAMDHHASVPAVSRHTTQPLLLT